MLFQIYIILYVINFSYLDFNFVINKTTIKDLESLTVFNFFQCELASIYIFLNTSRLQGKAFRLKKIYQTYMIDMQNQNISRLKANLLMIISLIIFLILFSLLIYFNPIFKILLTFLNLNKLIFTKLELFIPCCIYLIMFLRDIVNSKVNSYVNSVLKFQTIALAFITTIPITVLLFAVRVYLSNDVESSIIISLITSINLSLLFWGVKLIKK